MQIVQIAFGCLLLFSNHVMAQTGGIHIITEPNTTRAVSFNAVTRVKEPFSAATDDPLHTDKRTRVMIFAENFDVTVGDTIASMKAEAEDGQHQQYVLSIESINRVPGQDWLSAITLRVPDNMPNVGDVFVRLSYQGLSSNRVRVGLGTVGGGLSDTEVAAAPAPAPTAAPPMKPAPMPVNYTDPAAAAGSDAVRFLEQATFGPTKADLAAVRTMGYKAWLDDQFNKPLSTYDPAITTLVPSDKTSTDGCPNGAAASCMNEKYSLKPLQRRFFQNALYGQDQLRQRVVNALSQIIVVSGGDEPLSWPSYLAPYYQVLEKNAFGNYRQLLQDITLNPAMGKYLDMAGNNKSKPNENYAREILQLFSIGLYKLNPDGTYMKDDQGKLIPTYDQATINQFARVFTGWFIPSVAGQAGVSNYISPMSVLSQNHDTTAKVLLDNAPLPAGQSPAQDLDGALNNIFFHPNVGPFIGKQLIQKLVTSNPSPQYVARVSAVFDNNGSGVRGDMKAVITAILLDPEARGDLKNDPDYGHLREPALLMANVLRAFNAKSLDKTTQSDGYLYNQSASLDQNVLSPPTVFNFFPPDYAVPGTKLVGPEFGILSTNTVLKRSNFLDSLLFVKPNGSTQEGLPKANNTSEIGPAGTSLDLADTAATQINWVDLAKDPANLKPLLDQLDALMLHGTMSKTMRDSITTAVSAIPGTDAASSTKRARTAIYLVATSAQYQMEK